MLNDFRKGVMLDVDETDKSLLQPIRDDKYYYNVSKCTHKFYMFNEYYNLYYCESCNSYWTPKLKGKNDVYMIYTHVDFSRNDDRIINIWRIDEENNEITKKIRLTKKKILEDRKQKRKDEKLGIKTITEEDIRNMYSKKKSK